MSGWNPRNYLRFETERTRPARDLAARIAVDEPGRVVDLGCGPGNSTEVLHERWPRAQLRGLDASAEMLRHAREAHPDWEWEEADAATWQADPPADVLFSNACLQWLPHHESLLPRLFAQVAPGGALAMQVPCNQTSPLHRVLHRLTAEEPWKRLLQSVGRPIWSDAPEFYYDVLAPRAARIDLWLTQYHHVLDRPEDIVDWIRGTGLRPYLDALPDGDARATFEGDLLVQVREAYPPRADGRLLFVFPRIFLIAYQESA